MKLSAPVYHLKRRAKLLSRKEKIPLHEALGRIALKEGFGSWGLLIAKAPAVTATTRLYARMEPGDMVLVGARPGHGKTLLSLELAAEAMRSGKRSVFFTLEYTQRDIVDRFRDIGIDATRFAGLFEFDNSDAMAADYIMERLSLALPGTLAVIDYLQLLDQKRENPELMVQVRALKSFARDRGLIMVFISQIDRSYDPSRKSCPDLNDVRLPNPLDLGLFNKTCFLNDGEIQFQATG
jgi:hypothetical protein